MIALNKKNNAKAKEYLHQSIELSTENDKQKAKSHVLLAEMFYNEESYTHSQENYAACLGLIDENFDNYSTISKRANILGQLVAQLNTISKNDSLLLIANMSEDEIENMLYAQAQDIIEAEENA